MKAQPLEFLPAARRNEIISKEVDGELLIYDIARDKAHCLNFSASAIWKLCDGRTSVPEIARSVSELLNVSISEGLIQAALKQLNAHHLLAEGYDFSSLTADLSRRALVRKLGVGLSLLPLITSISAPTALAAVSCSGPCSGGPGQGTCAPGCVCSGITSTCVVA